MSNVDTGVVAGAEQETDAFGSPTKRAADLAPGDVVLRQAAGVDDEWAEVRAVEPRSLTTTVTILFAGGETEVVPAGRDWTLALPAAADAWRAEQKTIRRRGQIHDQLTKLAEQYLNGLLPLPVMGLHISATLHSAEEVEQAATVFGVEARRRDSGMTEVDYDAATTSGDYHCSVDVHFYHHAKTETQ